MTIVYLCAGLLLLSVLIAWYSYRTAFYSPEKRKEDYYAIPKGEQYEKERQRMLSLIREMDIIPFSENSKQKLGACHAGHRSLTTSRNSAVSCSGVS